MQWDLNNQGNLRTGAFRNLMAQKIVSKRRVEKMKVVHTCKKFILEGLYNCHAKNNEVITSGS